MSNEELKPCPFCGHEAEINTSEWSIECSYCPAYMGYFNTEQEAIEAWNRRATNESSN